MLGFLVWTLMGEPQTLRPRELAPWDRAKLVQWSFVHLQDFELLERRQLVGEDSALGVCDPELYGFRQTSAPRPGDIVCWRGGRALLSRLSRYISGCKYSHTGIVVEDGVVSHLTLSGEVEEPVSPEMTCFDGEFTDEQRAGIGAAIRERAAQIRGYGWHAAIALGLGTSSCLTRMSSVFHVLDMLLYASVVWFAGARVLAYIWVGLGGFRVLSNYGIRGEASRVVPSP